MPPYEVTKLVRSAGFDPLAPPLREGSTYVLRATDFRGILMRVVVDAHSGAFRAVNRIVSGPGPYGPIGMAPPPPYGMPPPYDMPPPYGARQAYGPPDGPEMMPDEEALAPPPLPFPPPAMRPGGHPSASVPPLPRPRPAELAARDTKAGVKPGETPAANPEAGPGATAIAPAPVAQKKPQPPPINE